MESHRKKILLVEDDERLAALVSDYLQRNDFFVHWESNGARVRQQLATINPDAMILDVMLPGMDGFALCRNIRANFTGPILMLTARDEDFDQVLGLENGADDYVVKPVEPRVLLARLHALFRRYPLAAVPATDGAAPLRFGELLIDASAREVLFGGNTIELSTHEFDLLLLLASRAGSILKRDELYRALHGRPYNGFDRTIDVRISHLRRKLGDNADNPERIKTVWGRGYLFVPDSWSSR